MKKNWTMKAAALMLALTMITACFVGSTFAKYVTKAEGEDSARVAKWGVLITVAGNAFSTKYKTHETGDNAYPGEFSVVASNDEQVVAPGTSWEDVGTKLTGTISGTPEVATRVSLTANTAEDVFLKGGIEYTDYTQLVKADDGTYGYTGKFSLEKDYSPVKWDMLINGQSLANKIITSLPNYQTVLANYGLTADGCSIHDALAIIGKVGGNGTYQQAVNNALEQLTHGNGHNFQLKDENGVITLSLDFDPNTALNYKFELVWSWKFEQENVELYDKADTYLGNVAAGVDGLAENENVHVHIKGSLVAAATQID